MSIKQTSISELTVNEITGVSGSVMGYQGILALVSTIGAVGWSVSSQLVMNAIANGMIVGTLTYIVRRDKQAAVIASAIKTSGDIIYGVYKKITNQE